MIREKNEDIWNTWSKRYWLLAACFVSCTVFNMLSNVYNSLLRNFICALQLLSLPQRNRPKTVFVKLSSLWGVTHLQKENIFCLSLLGSSSGNTPWLVFVDFKPWNGSWKTIRVSSEKLSRYLRWKKVWSSRWFYTITGFVGWRNKFMTRLRSCTIMTVLPLMRRRSTLTIFKARQLTQMAHGVLFNSAE